MTSARELAVTVANLSPERRNWLLEQIDLASAAQAFMGKPIDRTTRAYVVSLLKGEKPTAPLEHRRSNPDHRNGKVIVYRESATC